MVLMMLFRNIKYFTGVARIAFDDQLMGKAGFASIMACSVVMVHFTMNAWFFQCCVRNVLSEPILESTVSIQKILRSNGGGYTFSMSGVWLSMACADDIRRSLCQLSCSAVIAADLKIL